MSTPAKPFIWIKVEGGIADYGGDIDVVEVAHVDYDNEGRMPEELRDDIETTRRIPDRLAELPHDDPRWLDRDGIIATLEEDLAGAIETYGEEDGRDPSRHQQAQLHATIERQEEAKA